MSSRTNRHTLLVDGGWKPLQVEANGRSSWVVISTYIVGRLIDRYIPSIHAAWCSMAWASNGNRGSPPIIISTKTISAHGGHTELVYFALAAAVSSALTLLSLVSSIVAAAPVPC